MNSPITKFQTSKNIKVGDKFGCYVVVELKNERPFETGDIYKTGFCQKNTRSNKLYSFDVWENRGYSNNDLIIIWKKAV